MFLGHTALALAAKPAAPRLSLGVLLGAVFGLDLLWPVFLLLGVERVRIVPGATAFTPLAFESYPWSHSLLLALVWGALLAAVLLLRNRTARDATVAFALVVSHWGLDLLTHRPDLPLWPGDSPLLGLSLWNSIPATLLVEGGLFAACLAVYLRRTRAKDRTGTAALGALVLLQAAIWASGPFSPPPPSAEAIAWVGLATWLFIPWGAWIDRHRSARPG